MENKYIVKVFLNDKEGKSMTIEGTVSFERNENTHGNGYYMGVDGLDEPWGKQGYDIRYDKDFHRDEMILYIVKFYSDRFKDNSRYNMVGISVLEAK